jgi:hypothetical protein
MNGSPASCTDDGPSMALLRRSSILSGMSAMDSAPSAIRQPIKAQLRQGHKWRQEERCGGTGRSLTRFRAVEMKAHLTFAIEGGSHPWEEDPVTRAVELPLLIEASPRAAQRGSRLTAAGRRQRGRQVACGLRRPIWAGRRQGISATDPSSTLPDGRRRPGMPRPRFQSSRHACRC